VRAELPEGFRLLSCEPLAGDEPALSQAIRAIHYRVRLPEGAPDAPERVAAFAARPEVAVLRQREGKKPVRIDIKAALTGLAAEGPCDLGFTLRAGEAEATARPAELLAALFGEEWARPGVAHLVRESVAFGAPARREAQQAGPQQAAAPDGPRRPGADSP
jgi:hypothetical protein